MHLKNQLKKIISICTAAVSMASLSIVTDLNRTSYAAVSYKIINVSAGDIRSLGIDKAVQNALNTARDKATASTPYKVIVPKGTYEVSNGMRIYSNTCLSLNGVTLKRKSDSIANILRNGNVDEKNSGALGYDQYKNITIEGGTLNGSGTKNTVAKFAHASNVKLNGVTMSNVNDGHIMEVAGINGLELKNCSFSDQTLKNGTEGYEALQLDILVQSHFSGYRSEDLPMKNVSITGCSFKNCPRGIGSHTSIINRPFDGIKIQNCTFDNMTSIPIQGQNWINCDISDNTISNCPRGIAVFSIMKDGAGTYYASKIAKEGSSTAHVSDTYKEITDSNIVIKNNTITKCGTFKDKYAQYECGGIFAVSYKISGTSPVKSDDGSGGLKSGSYTLSGVNIQNNRIEANGHGIRLQNTKSAKVTENTITCSPNTFDSSNYYGIEVIEGNASSVANNVVSNANVNGIYVYTNASVGSISNNFILNAKKYGISIDNSSKVTDIANNTINASGSNAIQIYKKSSASNIKGNDIIGAKNHGVCIDSSSVSNLTGNIVRKASVNGIQIAGGSTVSGKINGNIISDVNHGVCSAGGSKAGSVSGNSIISYKGKQVAVTADSSASIGNNSASLPLPPASVSQVSFTNNTNSIKMTWGKVSGASGYRVYKYDTSKKTWTAVKDITDTSYTFTGLSAGSTYRFTVKPYKLSGGTKYTSASFRNFSAAALPSSITSASFTSGENSVKMTWSKVSGASGYRVYKYDTSKKTWTAVKDITGTSYTYTGLKSGTSYKFTVKPYKIHDGKKLMAASFKSFETTTLPSPVTSASFTSGTNSVKMTWSKVSGASGYRVYIYDNAKKTWTAVKDITDTSYTYTGLKSGTSYKFTVKPYRNFGGTKYMALSFTSFTAKTK